MSWIYSAVVAIRNKMFDNNMIKSVEHDIPIVVVGNLTVGGTGKTPITEQLVNSLTSKFNVAVLSRGYKRKSKGFMMVQTNVSYRKVGDEPKQIKLKFPTVPVAVCEDRNNGIKMLRRIEPDINLVILDDAFQHRYVEPWVTILLTDFNRPMHNDKMLPLGSLRDNLQQQIRANIVICTKCPPNPTPLDFRIIRQNLELMPYQHLFFTTTVSSEPIPMFPNVVEAYPKSADKMIAVAGIASPNSFFDYIDEKYTLVWKQKYPDHYAYKMKDLNKFIELLDKSPDDTYIVMTEKDAVKFISSKKIPLVLQRKMFYVSVAHRFLDDGQIQFNRILEQYVRENQKYNITHPV